MTTKPNRLLALSGVQTLPSTLKTPQLSIIGGYTNADISTLGGKLFEQTRLTAGITGRVQSAAALEAQEGSADVNLQLSTEIHPDHLALDWREGGPLRLNLAKLLSFKQIKIPRGHRMVVPLKAVTDPEYGPCVQLVFSTAIIEPRRRTGRRHITQIAAARSAEEQA